MTNSDTTVRLYILCGLPFSGKTVFAQELSKIKGWTRVDLDDVKFSLFGHQIADEELVQKDWDLVYQVMYKEIQDQLTKGCTVIHDTGNFTKHERDLVREIANEAGATTAVIWVNTPKSLAQERLLANRASGHRFDVSDVDFDSAVNEMEPPDTSENFLIYDTSQSLKDWIAQNL